MRTYFSFVYLVGRVQRGLRISKDHNPAMKEDRLSENDTQMECIKGGDRQDEWVDNLRPDGLFGGI